MPSGQLALLLAYCALLTGPASQIYRQVDTWQNLPAVGRAIDRRRCAAGPLILLAPDETTRALIDMYARTSVERIPGRIDPNRSSNCKEKWRANRKPSWSCSCPAGTSPRHFTASPTAFGRTAARVEGFGRSSLAWSAACSCESLHLYALPNGRRYALLERAADTLSSESRLTRRFTGARRPSCRG